MACAKQVTAPSSAALATPRTGGDLLTATATAATTAINGVMLQGFYWSTPISNSQGTWWQVLTSQAADFAAVGFMAVGLPPAYKGWNPNEAPAAMDQGYGVYDRYDLGEFNQNGSIATRYGTLAQLQTYVAEQ